MDYTVVFNRLTSNVSISPTASFKQGKFLTYAHGHHLDKAGKPYLEIQGLELYCHLDEEPEQYREVQGRLEVALYLAEEVMTEVSAAYQVECYLERPITCTYDGKQYRLDGSFWREVKPHGVVLRGGQHFADRLDFLDSSRNFHPMYHLYRTAKDESLPNDYRVLNAWRFLEAYNGIQGGELKAHLNANSGLNADIINDFYDSYRCAVAHATKLGKEPTTRSVIVPRAWETQFDGSVVLKLGSILDYLDKLVASTKDKEITNGRDE